MFTLLRISFLALGLLLVATRGFADEAEDRAERYFKKFRAAGAWRVSYEFEGDDTPTEHVMVLNLYFQFKITDETRKHLAGLKWLKRLKIQTPTLTDKTLKSITDHNELKYVELHGQITDDGLKHLAGLTKLRALTLGNMWFQSIKGTGLKHLKLDRLEELALRQCDLSEGDTLKDIGELTNLRKLRLTYTRITDQGLKHIAGLKKLQELEVGGHDGVTDQGMKYIAALTELRGLGLYGTKVTDAGLGELAPLQQLEALNLCSDAGVTDKGLLKLRALKKLRAVYVWGTRVTDKGVTELRKLRPEIRVTLHDEDKRDRRRR